MCACMRMSVCLRACSGFSACASVRESQRFCLHAYVLTCVHAHKSSYVSACMRVSPCSCAFFHERVSACSCVCACVNVSFCE